MSKRNILATLFFLIVTLFLLFTALSVHQFGNPDPAEMDDQIIGGTNDDESYGAQVETGANNAVTSVVFDYRGFDTLGEATVLFTAVAGVIMIFRRLKK